MNAVTGRSITAAGRGHRVSVVLALGAVTLALVLAGCGSSSPKKVSAGSYVNSVCTAATSWYRSILSAGGRLQATVHNSKSVSKAKDGYVKFVDEMLHATQRAERQLRNAGAPSVSGGKQLSAEVVRAFDRANRGLRRAAGEVRRAPTDSTTAFEAAAAGVQRSVARALQSMASVAPQKNPQLRSAALKEPSCQRLRRLG